MWYTVIRTHRPTYGRGIKRLLLCLAALTASGAAPADELSTDFEQHIRPLLAVRCVKCHGSKKQEGNLRLDSRAAMLRGGDSGPAIVPGNPAESLLLEAVRYESVEMPPSGQLPEKDVQQLVLWISGGALWPDHTLPIREASDSITAADRQWWAFQPLEVPEVPRHGQDAWSRTPIDRFVFQRLAENGMQPAPQASKTALVRRLYFDLVGMPPTTQQIDEFINDKSPDACKNLVDRLLDDQRYGEHWARYWLDIVRYSESDGWNQDAYRPHIWRYRDYVVKSFNDDKPYPEFVLQQLAGDEIASDDPQHLAAAGFLRLGIYEYNQRDARSHWNDILNEMTDVAGDVFLGMGMACARCHDHKFDPLLQQDYFKLRAFFEPIAWRDDLTGATSERRAADRKQMVAWEKATRDIRSEIDALLKPYYDRKWKSTVAKFPLDIQSCFYKPVEQRTSWEHQMSYLVSRQFHEEGGGPLKDIKQDDKQKYEALKEALAAFDDIKPRPLPQLMTVTDFAGAISPTVIPDDPQQTPVQPGFLSVLSTASGEGELEIPSVRESSGRRTALAKWIARPDNPLTTRVIVNRIWQQHFGRGIVSTANDFGHQGQPPTHPDLLDWLTTNFVENGWSFKHLHRLILTSAVWQQSAYHPQAAEYQQKDPADELLWRARIRRLRAEQIRDAMLSISGELQYKVGGPSVDEAAGRRALYVKSFRNKNDQFLHAFDMANGLKSISQRDTTTTPTQSLLLINGDYTLGRAVKLAQRLAKLNLPPPAELKLAFRLTWAREPTASEHENALQFVDYSAEQPDAAMDHDKRIDFCHVLLNSSEFLYLD